MSIGKLKMREGIHQGPRRNPTVPAGKRAVNAAKEKVSNRSGKPLQMPVPERTNPDTKPRRPHRMVMNTPKVVFKVWVSMRVDSSWFGLTNKVSYSHLGEMRDRDHSGTTA